MLVDRADAAMYAAKSLGRNRTYLFRELDEGAPGPPGADLRRAPGAGHRHRPVGQRHRHPGTRIGPGAAAASPRPSVRHDRVAGDRDRPSRWGCRTRRSSGSGSRRCSTTSGKIAIPEEILDKPSTLSDAEWQAIGEHPRIGQVILEQASTLREAIPVVLHHHERFNGGGYPHGLQGHRDPARRPDRRGGRCLPRHGPRPAVQRGAQPREGARGAAQPMPARSSTRSVVEVFCESTASRSRRMASRRSTASTSARAAGSRTSRTPHDEHAHPHDESGQPTARPQDGASRRLRPKPRAEFADGDGPSARALIGATPMAFVSVEALRRRSVRSSRRCLACVVITRSHRVPGDAAEGARRTRRRSGARRRRRASGWTTTRSSRRSSAPAAAGDLNARRKPDRTEP